MTTTLANTTATGPEPGIYRGMSAQSYHAIPYASASRLKTLRDSCPAMVRHEMSNPRERTRELVMGHATHSLALENRKVVTVAGKCCAILGGGKGRCKNNGKHLYQHQWYCDVKSHWSGDCIDEAAGLDVLTKDEYEAVEAMTASILANPDTAKYLSADARIETELSLLWDDPASGTRCKARLDMLCQVDGRLVIPDLKTTTDASHEGFSWAIKNFNYHIQSPMYVRGLCEALRVDRGLDIEPTDVDFVFLPVEKVEPYLCTAYTMERESMAVGDDEVSRLLEIWGECESSGRWPGYEPRTIGLPRWKRIED